MPGAAPRSGCGLSGGARLRARGRRGLGCRGRPVPSPRWGDRRREHERETGGGDRPARERPTRTPAARSAPPAAAPAAEPRYIAAIWNATTDIARSGACRVSACCSVGTLAQPAAPHRVAATSHVAGDVVRVRSAKAASRSAGSPTSSGRGPWRSSGRPTAAEPATPPTPHAQTSANPIPPRLRSSGHAPHHAPAAADDGGRVTARRGPRPADACRRRRGVPAGRREPRPLHVRAADGSQTATTGTCGSRPASTSVSNHPASPRSAGTGTPASRRPARASSRARHVRTSGRSTSQNRRPGAGRRWVVVSRPAPSTTTCCARRATSTSSAWRARAHAETRAAARTGTPGCASWKSSGAASPVVHSACAAGSSSRRGGASTRAWAARAAAARRAVGLGVSLAATSTNHQHRARPRGRRAVPHPPGGGDGAACTPSRASPG